MSHTNATDAQTFLLLDELTVAETRGLTLRYFAPVKSPDNPIIVKTEPWEGGGPYLWGNRLMRDPETGQYQLWYAAYRYTDNYYRWGYAVSDDGRTWQKPPLYIERFDGQPARNMLAEGPHPDKALRCIARDPRPSVDPARRYKAIRFTYEGEYASFSPDGIHWTEYEGNPVWHAPSDIIHTMWDPTRATFVAYFKIWEVSGQRVDPNRPGHGEPFRAYLPFYNQTNHGDRVELSGPVVTFREQGNATISRQTFSLAAGGQDRDDGGGGMLSGQWVSKRVQCWAESDDFIHWRNERVILQADENDLPSANIQYMFVFRHGGYYIGVLTMHDDSGLFHQQLAFSHDGIAWRRPWREPFLRVGPEGAFDSAMVLGPVDPVVLGDEMFFYYGGCTIPHYVTTGQAEWPMAIGRVSLRRDGFAAWQAGAAGGTLLTQPLRCPGGTLHVNADARGGALTVEVADADGTPIPGYDGAHSVALSGDATMAAARWQNHADLGPLAGQTVRLRFTLRDASLYAFHLTP